MRGDGVYELYVPGIVRLEHGRVVVSVGGEEAAAPIRTRVLESAGSGRVVIVKRGGLAWIAPGKPLEEPPGMPEPEEPRERPSLSPSSRGSSEQQAHVCRVEVRRGCPPGKRCLQLGTVLYVYSNCTCDRFTATVYLEGGKEYLASGPMERCEGEYCGLVRVPSGDPVEDAAVRVYLDGRLVGEGRLVAP